MPVARLIRLKNIFFEMGKMLTFGDIDIESFGVSHDAALRLNFTNL
jgi:phosphoribosyl 1,2-cyclic phosphodiesterase